MRPRRTSRPILLLAAGSLLALLAALVVAAPPADATFPGRPSVVAFVSDRDGDDDIYVVDPGTLAITQLTNDPAPDIDPAWSPGGDRLVFSSNRAGSFDLWLLDPGTSVVTQLTSAPTDEVQPAWSPNGDRIVYTTMTGGGDLWTVRSDGTDAHVLVGGAPSDWEPAWSPDGSRIAFSRIPAGGVAPEIAVTSAAGGGTVTTLSAPGLVAQSPSWSPTGAKIAYATTGVPNTIRTMDADGGNDLIVASLAAGLGNPSWSPDGTQLVLQAVAPGPDFNLYVVAAGGGAIPTPLVTDASNDGLPDWRSELKSALRLAGADRIETAVVISHMLYAPDTAGAALLTRSDLYPDALAGTPLAVAVDGPILLTPPAGLDPRTSAELNRALPAGATVYLLGDTEALSPAVEAAVGALGFTTQRLGGPTRYDTAAMIADQTILTVGPPAIVYLATGTRFAEGLAGGSAAARLGGVLVLTADDTMPPATSNFLAALPGIPRTALGPEASAADPGATSIAGSDPVDTVRLLAADPALAGPGVAVATSAQFPDALAGGVLAARSNATLVLADPTGLDPALDADLRGRAATTFGAFVFGGPLAVPDAVVMAVRRAITGV